LINFSLFFTQIAIDVSNLFSYQFYKLSMTNVSTGAQAGMGSAFASALRVSNLANTQPILDKFSAAAAHNNSNQTLTAIVANVILFLLYGSLAATLAYGMYLLGSRLVVMILLMVGSAIAFISYAIPGLKQNQGLGFDVWLRSLLEIVLFGPILSVGLWITLTILGQGGSALIGTSLSGAPVANLSPSVLLGVLMYGVAVGMLYATFKIAKSISSHGAYSAAGRATSAIGLGLAGAATARAGRVVLGGGANMVQRGLRNIEFKDPDSTTARATRAFANRLELAKNATFDARKLTPVKNILGADLKGLPSTIKGIVAGEAVSYNKSLKVQDEKNAEVERENRKSYDRQKREEEYRRQNAEEKKSNVAEEARNNFGGATTSKMAEATKGIQEEINKRTQDREEKQKEVEALKQSISKKAQASSAAMGGAEAGARINTALSSARGNLRSTAPKATPILDRARALNEGTALERTPVDATLPTSSVPSAEELQVQALEKELENHDADIAQLENQKQIATEQIRKDEELAQKDLAKAIEERIARGESVSDQEKEYVTASRAAAKSEARIERYTYQQGDQARAVINRLSNFASGRRWTRSGTRSLKAELGKQQSELNLKKKLAKQAEAQQEVMKNGTDSLDGGTSTTPSKGGSGAKAAEDSKSGPATSKAA
jgi:hypothetical protein